MRRPSCARSALEGKKPVITEVAGFELLAGFELSEPVVTKVAGFGRDFGPQLPGERTTIPDDLR